MIANPTPEEPQLFTSPDGLLALSVTPDAEDEILLGFHGFDWSVTASQLAEENDLDQPQAIKKFVANVRDDNSLIAVLFRGGEISDAWITEFPKTDLQHCEASERLEFRYWSGKVIAHEDL